MMSEALSDLLRRHLNGPRWEVTRDIVAELPGALDDVVKAVRDDLDLVIRQASVDNANAETSFVDLRITAEHIVLLLARLLPLTDSVLADLYMTEISEIERDEPPQMTAVKQYAAELRPLVHQLDDIGARQPTSRSKRVQALLDVSTVLASLHATAVRLLNELLVGRLDRSPTSINAE